MRLSAAASYGSGLPFAYGGSPADALTQYGPQVVSRLDFARGSVRSQLSVNASMSADLVRRDHFQSTLHADSENLNDRSNVLDFGGLFSGNAIAPALYKCVWKCTSKDRPQSIVTRLIAVIGSAQ